MDDNPYKAPQTAPARPLKNRAIIATLLLIVVFGIGFYLRGLPLIRFWWP